jgi:hypothetical protein
MLLLLFKPFDHFLLFHSLFRWSTTEDCKPSARAQVRPPRTRETGEEMHHEHTHVSLAVQTIPLQGFHDFKDGHITHTWHFEDADSLPDRRGQRSHVMVELICDRGNGCGR